MDAFQRGLRNLSIYYMKNQEETFVGHRLDTGGSDLPALRNS